MLTQYAKFNDLVGKTITKVEGAEIGSDEVLISCLDGSKFKMWHVPSCCEWVELADIVGDTADLLGHVLDAREETSEDALAAAAHEGRTPESHTWTFYIIQTNRGAVTLRWLGTSNGYYSEDVSFALVFPANFAPANFALVN